MNPSRILLVWSVRIMGIVSALLLIADNRVREVLFFVRSLPESVEGLAATYNLAEMIEIAKAVGEDRDWKSDDSRWTKSTLPTAEEVAPPDELEMYLKFLPSSKKP